MDFKSFKDKWLTNPASNVADAALSGIKPYQSTALIKQYLHEVFSIKQDFWGEVNEWWSKPNPTLLAVFTQLETNETCAGDIVLILNSQGYWHMAIATGVSNSTQTEILEQNGERHRGEGTDGDAIRTQYIHRDSIVGVFRSKLIEHLETVEQLPEETPLKLYKAPSGGMHVPRAVQQKVLIKVDLPTYPTPGLAQEMRKPTTFVLRRGMWEFDELKYGMLRFKENGYWINPAENVIKPVVVEPTHRPDTRHDYTWYDEPIKYKANNGYMRDHKTGIVQSFNKDKPNAVIERDQPVYIAGTFVEDDFLYGIPTNLKSDGTFSNASSYGVLMSYLSLVQIDYAIEENLIQDVEPVASKAPVRDPTLKDNITELRFRGQKLIDGFIRPRR